MDFCLKVCKKKKVFFLRHRRNFFPPIKTPPPSKQTAKLLWELHHLSSGLCTLSKNFDYKKIFFYPRTKEPEFFWKKKQGLCKKKGGLRKKIVITITSGLKIKIKNIDFF